MKHRLRQEKGMTQVPKTRRESLVSTCTFAETSTLLSLRILAVKIPELAPGEQPEEWDHDHLASLAESMEGNELTGSASPGLFNERWSHWSESRRSKHSPFHHVPKV